jgi:uridine monophosphate synthetase
MDFFARLGELAREKKSALCIGIDPRVDPATPQPAAAVVASNRRLIESTLPYAICYKPNIAFFEALGSSGFEALEETLSFIPDEIPVIIDAKRGDIGSTAEAYAAALFGRLGADAVTLSPYLGRDTVLPFLEYPGKGLFLLCKTSNPGAGIFQDLLVGGNVSAPDLQLDAELKRGYAAASPEPLYIKVARECLSWSPSIGLVVAGNRPEALAAVRAVAPEAWFLAPGIGAQGGDPVKAFAAGRREDGLGVLVTATRSVSSAADPGAAARELRDAMESARLAPRPPLAPGFSPAPASPAAALKTEFIDALIKTSCFRLGDFLLKSGKRSPFYIDLRRLVSDPRAMSLAGAAYAHIAQGLAYDRIAGIPAAGLPLATAAALAASRPMIWPRMPVKEHGTGNRVEGEYHSGERALLLDDLITTGASKLEAAEILRGEGLVIEDLVVLIERGKQGRVDMEAAGIRLHAFIHVRELFAACERLGLVDADRRAELEAYVDAE